MHIILVILLVIAGIIALLLILALFMRKEYNVRAELVINAPLPVVFDYVRHLKNQDNFNKWIMRDPDMTRTFTGTDGTVGFVYAWKDNKGSGEGAQEITGITEGDRVDIEIRFVKPIVAVGYIAFTTASMPGGGTKVAWSNRCALKYPLNMMVPMIEAKMPKDLLEGLENLKAILERQAAQTII